jgi:hypothetical protein
VLAEGASASNADLDRFWEAIVDDLYSSHLLSNQERIYLLEKRNTSLESDEARRRLFHWRQSLRDEKLRPSSAFRVPGLTTLVPSYNEAILNGLPDLSSAALREASTATLEAVGEARPFFYTACGCFVLGAMFGVVVQALITADSISASLRLDSIGAVAVSAAVIAILSAAGACWFWRVQRAATVDIAKLKATLAACGADVVPTRDKQKWSRMPENLDDAETVQAAQLTMRLHLGSHDAAPAAPARVGDGSEAELANSSAENKAWSKLPLYTVPADRAQRLGVVDLGFLMGTFERDFQRFREGWKAYSASSPQQASWSVDEAGLRRWASARMQTVYRTIDGTTKNHTALQMQLELALRGLDPDELTQLMKHKYRTVWALQTWGRADFTGVEVQDVRDLLRACTWRWRSRMLISPQQANRRSSLTCALRCCACAGAPKGVVVAYLLEEGGKHYSCLLENADSGVDERTHKPAPRFKIQLPGPPVLGDGKGDNQNCAIIYSRGHVLQAIDANQEGYLEECFKTTSALQEFCASQTSAGRGRPPPPTIVGFGEHIFSGLV